MIAAILLIPADPLGLLNRGFTDEHGDPLTSGAE